MSARGSKESCVTLYQEHNLKNVYDLYKSIIVDYVTIIR